MVCSAEPSPGKNSLEPGAARCHSSLARQEQRQTWSLRLSPSRQVRTVIMHVLCIATMPSSGTPSSWAARPCRDGLTAQRASRYPFHPWS